MSHLLKLGVRGVKPPVTEPCKQKTVTAKNVLREKKGLFSQPPAFPNPMHSILTSITRTCGIETWITSYSKRGIIQCGERRKINVEDCTTVLRHTRVVFMPLPDRYPTRGVSRATFRSRQAGLQPLTSLILTVFLWLFRYKNTISPGTLTAGICNEQKA